MSRSPTAPLQALLALAISSAAAAVADRPQTDPARPVSVSFAERMIWAMHPTDALQALLAGNILLIAELIKDCAKPRPSTTERDARAMRAEVLALTRALHTGIGKLERMQAHAAKDAAEGEIDQAPVPEPAASSESRVTEVETPSDAQSTPAAEYDPKQTLAAQCAGETREAVEQRVAAWIQRRIEGGETAPRPPGGGPAVSRPR